MLFQSGSIRKLLVAIVLLNVYGGLRGTDAGLDFPPNTPSSRVEPPPSIVQETINGIIYAAAIGDSQLFGDFFDSHELTPSQQDEIMESILQKGSDLAGTMLTPSEEEAHPDDINPVQIEATKFFMFFIRYWYREDGPNDRLPATYAKSALKVACLASGVPFLKRIFHEDDTYVRDFHGDYVLHYATKNNDMYVVLLWIDAGLDVNLVNYASFTPLHCAITNRNIDDIELLVSRGGANMNMRYPEGQSPLEFAISDSMNRRQYQPRHINQHESYMVFRSLCSKLTEPGLEIGYAMAFAFRSQDLATIDNIVCSIAYALYAHNDFDNNKVRNFMTIWTDLLQPLFLESESKAIVIDVEDGLLARVNVRYIYALYHLAFRRSFFDTPDEIHICSRIQYMFDEQVDMMSQIAYLSRGIHAHDEIGTICANPNNANGDGMTFRLALDEAEPHWSTEVLDDLGFTYEVVGRKKGDVG